jgi:hypothetical protein
MENDDDSNEPASKKRVLNKCRFGGSTKKLCSNIQCNDCFERSIVSVPGAIDMFVSSLSGKTLRELFKGSIEKVTWRCANTNCNHLFDRTCGKFASNIKCPFCPFAPGSKHLRLRCDDVNCSECGLRSLSNHPRSSQFRGLVNQPGLAARSVAKFSAEMGIWKCDKCPHTFQMRVSAVTNESKPQWCMYCYGSALCGCDICTLRSLASTPAGQRFVSLGNVTDPAFVFAKSNKVAIFKCQTCPHQYEQIIYSSNCCSCPYCSKPRKKLCGDEHCTHCQKSSVVGNERLLSLWADTRPPWTVMIGSISSCDWRCRFHGPWKASVNSLSSGSGCPNCVNPQESKLLDWFISQNIACDPQWKRDWCQDKRYLPFDFHIHSPSEAVVELDGSQHFDPQEFFGGDEKFQLQRRHDIHKMRCALSKGIPIIRLLTQTIRLDKADWNGWMTTALALVQTGSMIILEDNILYRRMYAECCKVEPSFPVARFVPMK